jgi:hypothetical protein
LMTIIYLHNLIFFFARFGKNVISFPGKKRSQQNCIANSLQLLAETTTAIARDGYNKNEFDLKLSLIISLTI